MMVDNAHLDPDADTEIEEATRRKEFITGALHYNGWYELWFNPKFLAFRISIVTKFKIFQASGSTATLLKGAGDHGLIPFIPVAYSVPYALFGAFITGGITQFSRGTSIRQRMQRMVENTLSELKALPTMVWWFTWMIHGCALVSSFCVFLSAFLSGKTLVTLLVHLGLQAMGAMVPVAVLSFFVGAVFPTTIALLTGFSAWYSFYAYSVPKADEFATRTGMFLHRYKLGDEERLLPTGAAFWGTIVACLPILVTSIFGGFYFVTHALSAIALTFGLTFLTPIIIKWTAIAFIAPSLVTTVATKVGNVYKFIHGGIEIFFEGKAWPIECLEVNNAFRQFFGFETNDYYQEIQDNRRFVSTIMLLSGMSIIELYHSGIGAWLTGCSFSRNVAHVNPAELMGWKLIFSRVLLLTLAASETLQNIAFTILPMLQELVEADKDQRELFEAIRADLRHDPSLRNFSHNKA